MELNTFSINWASESTVLLLLTFKNALYSFFFTENVPFLNEVRWYRCLKYKFLVTLIQHLIKLNIQWSCFRIIQWLYNFTQIVDFRDTHWSDETLLQLNIALKKYYTPQQTSVFKNGKLFILYEKVLIWTQIHSSSFWLEGKKNNFSFIVAAGEKKKCQKCVHLWGHQTHNRVTSKPASRSANIIHLMSAMPHSSSVSTERTSETDKTPAVLDRVVAFQNKFLQEQGQRNTAFCIFLKLSLTT